MHWSTSVGSGGYLVVYMENRLGVESPMRFHQDCAGACRAELRAACLLNIGAFTSVRKHWRYWLPLLKTGPLVCWRLAAVVLCTKRASVVSKELLIGWFEHWLKSGECHL